MLHPVFSDLFQTLLSRWRTYQEAPRDPERVTTLARAWMDLEDTRAETAAARNLHHPEWGVHQGAREPVRKMSVTAMDVERLKISGISAAGRA